MTSEPEDSGIEPILELRDLRVTFATDRGTATTVDGLSFRVERGETVGIVGESGSGKSMASMATLGLLPRTAKVSGSIRFRGRELVGLGEDEFRQIRGNEIAMVFQDALAALNPVMSVGAQLAEAVRVHRRDISKQALRERAIALLDSVGIANPGRRVDQYPHEFSGGMRQRVMIAMSIANDPALLIADEPTTALDVTVQAQILEVLREVQDRTGTTMLLITHDLGVVAGIADRVLVMYAGNLVEEGDVDSIFYDTAHPYTAGLLASLPRMDRRAKGTRLHQIAGQPPASTALPPGCRFAPRCPYAVGGRCDVETPQPVQVDLAHRASCVRLGELTGLTR
jgi:oligopeptide/dipeptide ABC transporter ATP-binding protein